MAKIDELRERLSLLNGEALKLQKVTEDENRDLNAEETADMDSILANFDRTKKAIDQLSVLTEQTELLQAGTGRKTEPDQPIEVHDDGVNEPKLAPARPPVQAAQDRRLGYGTPDRTPAQPYRTPPKTWGFQGLGDFAISVKNACLQKGGQWDPRLIVSERLAAATIYGSEGVGSDGGFAVPPDFRTSIMEAILGEESLLSRCDQVTVSGNSFTAPVDMTTPWQTSGGIQAYWGGEGGTKTQSKPLLQERTVKVNKCYALVPMTDELVEDAAGMETYLRKKAPEKIAFAVNLAILQGNGVGKPLGVINSPALVSVAKNNPQTADTITAANILAMYSRMYAPSRNNAVWVINQDIEPQLSKLSMPGTDNAGNTVTGWGGMVYLPANGFSGSPFATLFGRPVIPSQACETLGDQGDIFFIDFKQYLLLLKGGTNPKVDVSMHLWFDQDLTAFRFVLRVGGMPWWDAAVSARDGSTTYSPYVSLDERA